MKDPSIRPVLFRTLSGNLVHEQPPATPDLGKSSYDEPKYDKADRDKVPMNKVQVGTAASPNIKNVKSRIGSLANSSYKPGGGNIKIESHKVDVSKASTKIQAKSSYKPQGGNKKIETRKLDWKAQPKVGSMNNSGYKPGGGNIKVVTQKVDIKASAKVGSRDNIQHKPGGGDVKVETVKINLSEVSSRINSLDNVNHKPQGGDKKIFNDTDFLRQISSSSGSGEGRSRRRSLPDSIDGATELRLLCQVPADSTVPRFENVEFLAMACMGSLVDLDSPSTSYLVLLFKTLHYLRWFLPMVY